MEALYRTDLLDTPASPALERLTRLTTRLLGVPTAVVTLVDRDRQFFAAADGLAAETAELRETPLSHSFCQHVVAGAAPLVVRDATRHPLVSDIAPFGEIGAQAYAGMPLITSDGHALGSFCAFDPEPRDWSDEDLLVLQDLASAAMTEIELRFASRLLEEQGEQLRQLLDNTNEIVARLAPDGTPRWSNAAWDRLLGAPALESPPLRQILEDASVAPFDAAWERVVGDAHAVDLELRLLPPGGQPLELAVRLVPNLLHGQVRGVRLYARDITESRRVERLKDQMIGIVSHELRTPIGAIQGSLQLLGRLLPADTGPRERELIALASRNTHRLLSLVNDLLDLEKLEAGDALLELEDTPLAEVFAVARDATETVATRQGVTLRWDDAGAVVRADAARLAQVVINLVGNAVKFSPRDGTVRIRTLRDDDRWRVDVVDEGRGIPARDLQRIFERFTQVAKSDATEKGGSGLGLAIARAIVLRHGGRIWVESEEGQGSSFSFTVPVAAGASA